MLAMVSQTFNRIWEQKAKEKGLDTFSLGGKEFKGATRQGAIAKETENTKRSQVGAGEMV